MYSLVLYILSHPIKASLLHSPLLSLKGCHPLHHHIYRYLAWWLCEWLCEWLYIHMHLLYLCIKSLLYPSRLMYQAQQQHQLLPSHWCSDCTYEQNLCKSSISHNSGCTFVLFYKIFLSLCLFINLDQYPWPIVSEQFFECFFFHLASLLCISVPLIKRLTSINPSVGQRLLQIRAMWMTIEMAVGFVSSNGPPMETCV